MAQESESPPAPRSLLAQRRASLHAEQRAPSEGEVALAAQAQRSPHPARPTTAPTTAEAASTREEARANAAAVAARKVDNMRKGIEDAQGKREEARVWTQETLQEKDWREGQESTLMAAYQKQKRRDEAPPSSPSLHRRGPPPSSRGGASQPSPDRRTSYRCRCGPSGGRSRDRDR